jgi:cytochrome b6-f complex iron-sulfur subunit
VQSPKPESRPVSDSPPQPGRRRFAGFLLGGGLFASAVSFLYPILRYLVPPETVDLGGDSVVAAYVGELKRGSAKIFPLANRPALLVFGNDGEYHAMSAVCTHLNCTVQYVADVHNVWCACHNGRYDLTGRNISGPPPRPLEQFDVHVRGDEIVVSRQRNS